VHCQPLGAVLGLWLAISPAGEPAAAAPLTSPGAARAIYDLILEADFAAASAAIATCEGLPREACLVLDATRLWWAILLEPHDTGHDDELSRAVERAIAATQTWTAREPDRAEAWFYLGGAYGIRVQWRAHRGERLAAARDGARIKAALERALGLDPSFDDAQFGIGLYQYYAAIAPASLRVLRTLLLLPGGDREEGLARLRRTRQAGLLLRGEADYQLHLISLWYEGEFAFALWLLEDLHARHPRNPLFLLRAAEVHDVYFHDLSASLRTYERLLDLAMAGQVNEAALARARARIGAATARDRLFETDRAIAHLEAVVAEGRVSPSTLAQAWLLLGRARDRLGWRDAADAAFREADALAVRDAVRAARRARPPLDRAAAYRTALRGWRAFERGDRNAALAGLERALAAAPDDTVARYRYAHVLAASGRRAAAFEEYTRVIEAGALTPPVFRAAAHFEAAALIESTDPGRARRLYEEAAHTFGASSEIASAAARAAARLRPGADTPRPR
jgi:tetratricopeptide (TPR) repeat protein